MLLCKNLLKFCLPLLIALSLLCGGMAISFSADVTINDVVYVPISITAEQLYAMFTAGDLKISFFAEGYEDGIDVIYYTSNVDYTIYTTGEDVAPTIILDKAFYSGNLFIAMADYVVRFDNTDIEDTISDSGVLSYSIELPFDSGIFLEIDPDTSIANGILFYLYNWGNYDDYYLIESDDFSTLYLKSGNLVNHTSSLDGSFGLTTIPSELLSFFNTLGFSHSATSLIGRTTYAFYPNYTAKESDSFVFNSYSERSFSVDYSAVFFNPVYLSFSGFTYYVPDVIIDPEDPDSPTYADMVESYLISITTPTVEGQAKADELKSALDSASEELKQMGNDLSVYVPSIENNVDTLPDEALNGLDIVGQNFLFSILNQPLVVTIFGMLFVLLSLKLILFGSGSS